MNESQFVNQIDCRFPYDDLEAGLRLAAEACGISANAAFAVIHELARPPRSAVAPRDNRLAIVERIESSLQHPLAPTVIELARRLIRGEQPSIAEAVAAMRLISTHRGQLAALSVAYMACDDVDGEADREYQRIVTDWEDAGRAIDETMTSGVLNERK